MPDVSPISAARSRRLPSEPVPIQAPVGEPEKDQLLPTLSPDVDHSLDPAAPLCVDLDGTLVKSDTLVDSALALARHHPAALLKLPGWLMQGKAALKQHIAAARHLDVAHLPYNRELLQYLEQQHATGRPIYLATAADAATAHRIADHLGIFTGVLASDGKLNLAGHNKLAAFRAAASATTSATSATPAPTCRCSPHCRQPMVANPTPRLLAGLRAAHITPVRIFDERVSPLQGLAQGHPPAPVGEKRPHLPSPAARPRLARLASSPAPLVAFLSFGLCASATYIVNDLLDLEADRQHPRKRRRPFAAGDLSAIAGVAVVALFLLLSLALAISAPALVRPSRPTAPSRGRYSFLTWLGIYAVTTLAYSLRLKRIVLVDVIVLSGLYTIRILAGSAATGITVSTWLAGFSIFFFLSLAFVKRFAELESLRERGGASANGRGYHVSDIEQLRSFGTAAATPPSSSSRSTSRTSTPPSSTATPTASGCWSPSCCSGSAGSGCSPRRGELTKTPSSTPSPTSRSLLLGVARRPAIVALRRSAGPRYHGERCSRNVHCAHAPA